MLKNIKSSIFAIRAKIFQSYYLKRVKDNLIGKNFIIENEVFEKIF